jgi:aconitate hydratase
LCNPLVAALIALKGEVVDTRRTKLPIPKIENPPQTTWPDPLIQPPPKNPSQVKIIRGPNIKAIPPKKPLPNSLKVTVLIKTGDHISTDDILPGGSEVLPFRSNIPAISRYTFSRLDRGFAQRAMQAKGGIIVGGENYGQGSSREHAVLAPMFLGIQAVLVKSFARIHLSNLINYGIIPLVFNNPKDFELIDQNDLLEFDNLKMTIRKDQKIKALNLTKKTEIILNAPVPREKIEILLAGGLLAYLKKYKSPGK